MRSTGMDLKLSSKQKVAILILIVGLAGIALSSTLGVNWVVALAWISLFLLGILILRAVERSASLQYRKIEKSQRMIAAVQKRVLEINLQDVVSSLTPSIQLADDAVPDRNTIATASPDSRGQSLSEIAAFVERVNRLSLQTSPVSSPQVASINEVVESFNIEEVFASDKYREALKGSLTGEVFELRDVRTSSKPNAVIVGDRRLSELSEFLIADGLRDSILLVLTFEKSSDSISITGFEEIMPLDVSFGLRVFYPSHRVIRNSLDSKYATWLNEQQV